MKKILTITLLLVSVTLFSEENRTSYSITAGTEYLNEFFMNFGFSIIKPLDGNKEIDIKVSMDMTTIKSDSEVTPVITVPIKLGINFLFPINEKFTFLAGPGLSPTMRLLGDDTGFLLGPNVKLGLRFKIHPSMSIFLEGCQSVLIGKPDWIYSSTEIVFGVNFFI